jgi:hypothetical protein
MPATTVGTQPGARRGVPTVARGRHHVRTSRDEQASRDEEGAVTAEAAAVLPLLVAVALGFAWLVSLTVAQVRVVDAAREVARAVARGDAESTAISLGRRVAPEGTHFVVGHGGGSGGVELVSVAASTEVRGPGGLFSFLPGVGVDSTAVAQLEPR